ncbi:MAG: translation initiation factor IF-2 [Candidatus Krumholzibacteriales bacterium]
MSKIRVYELAKKYGVTSKDVIRILVKEGIMVKSHMSTVDEQVESLIKHHLQSTKSKKKKPPERKKAKTGKKPAARKKKPGKKKEKKESDQKAVRESVRRTLAKLDIAKKSKRSGRKKKKKQETVEEENVIKLPEYATISEMAEKLEVDPTEIIRKCMDLGMMVTINQRIDSDAMSLIADEYGFEIEFIDVAEEGLVKREQKQIDPDRMVTRPPVVTIMGHVDHGKTSLLDTIRESNMVAGEKGGITQHIGAYVVDVDGRKISFVDTPGHEAFTAMRARGAEITDIVVLIVAADDGVMSQTVEAINHARVADVPIVVAINKIDLPNADINKVKRELLEHDVVLEEYGGNVMAAEISATSGEGIDRILEMILLQAEMKDLKADPEAMVQGAVIEAEKEKGRGIICTVLIQQGTLRVGDYYIVGNYSGRVKAMMDERENKIDEAPPSTPAVVMGTKGVPQAGDMFFQVEEEKSAKQIAKKRQQVERERERRSETNITLEDLYDQIQSGKVKELLLVIKADTDGSVEALVDSLESLDTEEVKIEAIHTGVGMINESDILLASASNAIVIGFHESVAPNASKLAKSENVDIRLYDVIYKAIDDMKAAMSGLLEPEIVEKNIGEAEVRQVFHVSGVGLVAGSFVKSGEIRRNAFARVLRGDEIVFEGKIDSLKRFKEDVGVVQSGYECGIGIEDYEYIEEGDTLQVFVKEEKSRSI